MVSFSQKYKKEYVIWNKLFNFCTKKESKKYSLFGGAGFTIDKNWNTFRGFFDDMGEIKTLHDGIKILGDCRHFDKFSSTYCKIKKGIKCKEKTQSFRSKKDVLKKAVSFTLSLSGDMHKYIKKQALSRSVQEQESYNINDLIREALTKCYPLPDQFDMFGDKK